MRPRNEHIQTKTKLVSESWNNTKKMEKTDNKHLTVTYILTQII